MNLEEGLEVIRREMLKQSEKHKQSASKKAGKYQSGVMSVSLFEAVRLAVTAEMLEGLGNALSVEKVAQWRLEQLEQKSG